VSAVSTEFFEKLVPPVERNGKFSFAVIETIAMLIWKFLLSTSKEIESKTSKIEEQFVAIRIFNVQLVDYLI